ncbi:MAG: Dihydrodipicolinate synthase [Lactococcus sp.]|jgi:hypothetical protein
MNRILACTASDFGKETTPLEIKNAIKASEGRVVLVNLAAKNAPLYPEVTNGEMAAAFGADLLLLKGIDVKTLKIAGLGEISHLSELRKLTGTGVGINLEIADGGPEFKRLTPASLAEVLTKGADFLSLTAYVKPEATPERIISDIHLVRGSYAGLLALNPVLSHGADLKLEYLLAYVEAGALVSTTVGTSQEGTDKATIQSIALAAKRARADVFELGDAGVAGMPVPTTIYNASIAIRGRRHTFVRMARGANR